MSNLETSVQPVLEQMMDGRTIELARPAQSDIAAWALKTAMMVEFLTSFREFSQADRSHLRRQQEVPEGHTVFIAAFDNSSGSGFFSYSPLRFASRLGRTTCCAMTLVLDHFVCQVIGSSKVGDWVIDVDHPATDLQAAIQVWPSAHDVVTWPPKRVLDTPQLRQLMRMLLP
jgi:hypothetical protein